MEMSIRTRNILIIVGAIILAVIAWYFRAIVTYIIIAAVVSTIGRPLSRWLQSVKIWKIRFNTTISALLTLVAIWVVFLGFFIFLIPLLANEFGNLGSIDVNALLAQLEVPLNSISKLIFKEPISLTDGSLIGIAGTKVASFFKISQVTDLFGTIVGAIGGMMVGLFSVSFITFFFLKDEGMFRNGLLLLTPTAYDERVSRSFDRITLLLRRYFIGLVLEVFLVAVLSTIGLTIIGLDFGEAVLIGLLCGLFNVIPYLGPWIGAIVGILIVLAVNVSAPFMTHTLPMLCFMVVVVSVVQVIDNMLIQPMIYSSSVKAHPLEVFLVIMAAGSLAGITGMILAVPVYTILRVFAAEFLSGFKLVQKLTANMEGALYEDDVEERTVSK
jgi:predicted PurR-regulated permease PerM